jgi:hypothetical protein
MEINLRVIPSERRHKHRKIFPRVSADAQEHRYDADPVNARRDKITHGRGQVRLHQLEIRTAHGNSRIKLTNTLCDCLHRTAPQRVA